MTATGRLVRALRTFGRTEAPLLATVAALFLYLSSDASAQGMTEKSAANLPYSGISPGGVDMSTGELILVMRPDLVLDGPLPVVYGRYYASFLATDGQAAGHMGPNWLGTYDWKLAVVRSSATLVTNRGAVIRFTQNPVGSWDLTSPTYAKFKLDVLPGGTWRFTNPLDRKLYFFDGLSWLLNQIEDEHGNSLTILNAGGLPTQVSDGLGRTLSFTYDPAGHVTQVSDGTRAAHYRYAEGVLTGVTDAAGRSWTYGYSVPPLLTGATEPVGNTPATQAYDVLGRVTSQTDAAGSMAMYSYGAAGSVFTDPLGNPWTYQHDASGHLVALANPAGGPTSFSYDASGRLTMAARPMGDATSLAYDGTSGYPSMMTFADGSALLCGYSSHSAGGATFFDLSTQTFPDLTTESYGRDASGNLTNLTDQAGRHWLGTYNGQGQLLTWTNPSGGMTTFTYDPQGRLMTGKDDAGNTTSYGYDALSRLTQVTWPNTMARTYGYDAMDHLTSVTNEHGKLWSYAYDANERLVTATDPLMAATGYLYDALDRMTQTTDALGHAAAVAFDPNGRVMTATDRSGRTTRYQYDALNRLTGVMDPTDAAAMFAYDADGRMTSTRDPLGHTTTFVYDMLDRPTHVTDRVGTGFDYSYDVMGRLHTATAPLGRTKTFTYDVRGLLTSFSDASSEWDLARTVLGQVSQVTDPNRNLWAWSYDAQGRLISSADPLSRTMTYEYDGLSRPIHVGRPDGSLQQITYDPAGNVTGQSFGTSLNLSYDYDDANRLTSATAASFSYDATGRMLSSNGFGMTYDPDGRILSETLAPGKSVSYDYDSRGLPSHVTDWTGGTTTFTYDAGRRLTGIARPNGTHAIYAYDNVDRLTSAVEVDPDTLSSIQITRDALGEPVSISRHVPLMPGQTLSSTHTFTYDAASQPNGVSHDPLGRMTADDSRALQWDGASRLVHVAAEADSPSFTFDAFGHALSTNMGNLAVAQAWNYAHSVPTNDDLQVSLPSRTDLCVRSAAGLLLYRVDASTGARTFYHYDERGNTVYLTNDLGSVTTRYAYGPYGGVSSQGQAAQNSFTFGAASGMMSLGSSGLWTAGARVYDDRTMRIVSGNTTRSGRDWVSGPYPQPWSSSDWVMLNPQPFPPSPSDWVSGPYPQPWSSSDWVALNPQPFPPSPSDWVSGPQPHPWSSGDWVMLNPQPFPPSPSDWVSGPQPHAWSSSDWVTLNPQPFPPSPSVWASGPTPWPWSSSDWAALDPQRFPPSPSGTQTAVVVGASGDEISTDKYGRVKVQFHWDRNGRNDASSSWQHRVMLDRMPPGTLPFPDLPSVLPADPRYPPPPDPLPSVPCLVCPHGRM